jgi:hypothetical protein
MLGAPGPDGTPSETLAALYRSARQRTRSPLADGAGRALLRAARPGRGLVITTGLVTADIPAGETDGPPGAAVLARALALGCGAEVLLLTEAPVVPILAAALETLAGAAGDASPWRERVSLEAFPAEPGAARSHARGLWTAVRPAAVVAVEKLGPNARGIVHTMRGEDVTPTQARVELLFGMARRRGVLTVGVGDRGNEIGMGGLLRTRARCGCGCGGSIACSVAAERPVVALTSNWGSYAVAAALAARTGRPVLLHAPHAEAEVLRAIARAGAVDGVTRRRGPSVDGGSLALQTAVVAGLQAFVRVARCA